MAIMNSMLPLSLIVFLKIQIHILIQENFFFLSSLEYQWNKSFENISINDHKNNSIVIAHGVGDEIQTRVPKDLQGSTFHFIDPSYIKK